MIEIRPSAPDANTSALDVKELRKGQKEASRATKDVAAAKARTEGRLPPRIRLILGVFAIVVIGALGYTALPRLTQVGGPIGRLLNRLPDTPELTEEQRGLLQAAAISGSSDPSSAPVEMILAGTRKETPVIYLAAGLSDNTSFRIELRANPSQITTLPPPPVRLTVELFRRLTHSEPVRAADGSTLPRGEYQATVTDNDGRVRLSRQIWLGADRDGAFNKELAEYQRGLRAQAQNELQNLNDAATKLLAISDGDTKAATDMAKAKTPALRARVVAAWTADRTKLADEVNSLLLPESHYFKTAKSAALSLRDAIQTEGTVRFSFPGSVGALATPSQGRGASPATTPPNAEEASQRVAQTKSVLAGKLNEAAHKLNASAGYLEEEK